MYHIYQFYSVKYAFRETTYSLDQEERFLGPFLLPGSTFFPFIFICRNPARTFLYCLTYCQVVKRQRVSQSSKSLKNEQQTQQLLTAQQHPTCPLIVKAAAAAAMLVGGLNCLVNVLFMQLVSHPTARFSTFQLNNPSQDVSELYKIRRSPDLETLTLWKDLSGSHSSSVCAATAACDRCQSPKKLRGLRTRERTKIFVKTSFVFFGGTPLLSYILGPLLKKVGTLIDRWSLIAAYK